jgi:hypothetical protein
MLSLRPFDILQLAQPDMNAFRGIADIDSIGGFCAQFAGALDQRGTAILSLLGGDHLARLSRRYHAVKRRDQKILASAMNNAVSRKGRPIASSQSSA